MSIKACLAGCLHCVPVKGPPCGGKVEPLSQSGDQQTAVACSIYDKAVTCGTKPDSLVPYNEKESLNETKAVKSTSVLNIKEAVRASEKSLQQGPSRTSVVSGTKDVLGDLSAKPQTSRNRRNTVPLTGQSPGVRKDSLMVPLSREMARIQEYIKSQEELQQLE